jgi:hypothetical protein
MQYFRVHFHIEGIHFGPTKYEIRVLNTAARCIDFLVETTAVLYAHYPAIN